MAGRRVELVIPNLVMHEHNAKIVVLGPNDYIGPSNVMAIWNLRAGIWSRILLADVVMHVDGEHTYVIKNRFGGAGYVFGEEHK